MLENIFNIENGGLMKSNKKGISRIIDAFKNSWDGFCAVFKSEEAFRLELLMVVVLLPVALLLNIGVIAKVLLISSLFLVILMELVNTAIEVIIDRISDEYHELSKKAKDIGSLLVLLAFVYLVVVWAAILVMS